MPLAHDLRALLAETLDSAAKQVARLEIIRV
jgi:hypothetical protein